MSGSQLQAVVHSEDNSFDQSANSCKMTGYQLEA